MRELSKAKETASQTLADLRVLERTPAFDSYMLAYLRRKRDELQGSVLHDEMTGEERERKRQAYLLYRDLCDKPERDKREAEKLLEGDQV